jgi:hypothetical protein
MKRECLNVEGEIERDVVGEKERGVFIVCLLGQERPKNLLEKERIW